MHIPFRSLFILIYLSASTFVTAVIAESEVLKVGVSAPLTGDLAEYGAAVRGGITVAQEEHPADFARINFIFEDNQYESSKALTAYRKLHDLDKVDLIYNWGEPPLHAIAPLAEKAQFPVVAMSLDPSPSIGKKFIVRSINYSDQYAEKLVTYLRSKGWKKIAILKTEDPFLNSMVDGVRKHLGADQSLTVFATFTPEDQDFKTQITKLKAASFDVIGVYLFTGQVSAFYRQAAAQHFSSPTFGTDFFESKTEIAQAEGGMNGAVYPNLDVPNSFAKAYSKRFGNDAQIAYAYNAYEFAKVTSKLFPQGRGALNATQVIAAYASPPAENMPFVFRDTQQGGKFYEFPLVIKKIVGDKITKVE